MSRAGSQKSSSLRRSNPSILKEISPGCSLEGLMLKLKCQYFGHLMQRTDSLEKTLMLGGIWGRRRRDDRGWDGWMASLTRWTWVWVNFRNWWWTGRPGVLRFMGSQRVRHDWVTELNWTEANVNTGYLGAKGSREVLWWWPKCGSQCWFARNHWVETAHTQGQWEPGEVPTSGAPHHCPSPPASFWKLREAQKGDGGAVHDCSQPRDSGVPRSRVFPPPGSFGNSSVTTRNLSPKSISIAKEILENTQTSSLVWKISLKTNYRNGEFFFYQKLFYISIKEQESKKGPDRILFLFWENIKLQFSETDHVFMHGSTSCLTENACGNIWGMTP